MNHFTQKFKLLFLLCTLITLQSCATTTAENCKGADCEPVTQQASDSGRVTLGISSYQPEYVIATDLVNALIQLPIYSQPQSTIKLPNSNSTFMSAMQDILLKRGFRVERSAKRTGRGVLMVSTIQESRNPSHFTYILAVDRLAMKRTYIIKNRIVAPISSLFVRGISPTLITLNDGLFVE